MRGRVPSIGVVRFTGWEPTAHLSSTSSPSCSLCLGRSEPPTMPTVTRPCSSARKERTGGEIGPRGGVSVPSTSKRARMLELMGGRGEAWIGRGGGRG